MFEYHIIVGESTPQAGGMCAHMTLLADGLADKFADVHVWSPSLTELSCRSPAVTHHKTLGRLSLSGFRRTGKLLNRFPKPRRLLVYWVPHAYGCKSMNVPFCLWIWFRSAWHGDRVEPMVQECFLDFTRRSWRQSAAALIHRVMTIILLNAAHYVWVALSTYEARLRPYALGRRVPFGWLPVPSNVAVIESPEAVAQIRKRLAPHGILIGHFGTFGRSITELVERIVPVLLHELDSSLVLLGSGGEAFRDRLLQLNPDLAGRIHSTGYLDDASLSPYLSACDLMIQPYPDGITARRGSALAPLAHGCPIITNSTDRTEPLWSETGSVVLTPLSGGAFLEAVRRLQDDPSERSRVSAAARQTYQTYFEPTHMITTIQHAR